MGEVHLQQQSVPSILKGASLAASVLVQTVLTGALLAQETMQLPAYGEVIDVRVLELDVVVTRGGDRVRGLAAPDFRLSVDGEEIPIEYFSEMAEGRTVASASGRAERDARPVDGTRYLVFIDDDFSVPTYRNRALRALADQVSLLEPEDRMAVVAFDGRKLELLSSWTRSLAQLEKVFADAEERRAYGLLRRSEHWRGSSGRTVDSLAPRGGSNFSRTDSFRSGGFRSDGLGPRGGADGPAALRYTDEGGQVARVVRAASSALRGFARPPGRKVMLLLAGGWQSYWRDADQFHRQAIERRLFAPLIDTANRLGYTLYPVDLQNDSGIGSSQIGVGNPLTGRLRTLSVAEIARRGEDALYYLARETGGRAWMGGAGLSALERVIDDTRAYYLLGFSPTWREDDEQHDVRVEVRGKGMRARSRRSFSDLSRQREVSMWVESAHLFDLPLAEGRQLTVELGEAQPSGRGKVVLPVRFEVAFEHLTVLPQGDAYIADLELRVAATDSGGARADLPIVPVRLSRPDAPTLGEVGTWETQLKLRRRPHRLLFVLFDPIAETVLSRRIEFVP